MDIEFVVSSESQVYLLQVRPITTIKNWNRAIVLDVNNTISSASDFVNNILKPQSDIFGNINVLGQMPDWNPAEIIGKNPCALSFSLYETLITDKAWSSAREIMGYNAPVGRPLMYAIAGQRYIDVRLSFNSFLPKNLPNKISTKLIDKYISTLINNPHLHDKVEFDVMITSYCFNFDYKIDCLVGSVLSNEEKQSINLY